MESSHWPLILIEGVLVFGGALAFGWWQLRSVKRDREESKRRAEQARAAEQSAGQGNGVHSPDRSDSPGTPGAGT
jgi:hypothetical protein